MTGAEQPHGPRQLDLGALTDEDFEILCYLIVLIEFPNAVRLRAPDSGADSALPADAGRTYDRCWQAKRFTSHVHWAQCLASLDAAVSAYHTPHYTFCFARDLTGGQEREFKKRLVGRHVGVTVGYWGASRLLGSLLRSDQGQRIANHFYPDPGLNASAVMQAIRASGPLETGADAVARLRAVGEWLASHDPFFSYPTYTRETGIQAPGLTPGAVIAVEEIGPDLTQRIEAVPRNEAAMDEYAPAGTLLFAASEEGRQALESFQRALTTGEQVTISKGVGLRFDRLPPLMQPHLSEEPMAGLEITIAPSEATPRPWPARIVARSDSGKGEINIDLEPVQPPENWDGALEGSRGGLTATLLFRRTPAPRVAFKFNFSYDSTLQVVDLLAATTTLIALHGKGTLAIHARDHSRPKPLNFDFDGGELPPFFPVLHRLLGDLRLIEEWVETTLPLPREITREEMLWVAELAFIIRNRKSQMTFDQLTLELDEDKSEPFKTGVPGPFRLALPLVVNLFGRELPVGHLVGELPSSEVKVARITPVQGVDPPMWSVRLEPATEEARHPTFRFQREAPEPTAPAIAHPKG